MKFLSIIPILLVLLFGLYLRHDNYLVWPRLGATFDEYAWTWQGMNLIQTGTPVSWSPLPAYTNFDHVFYHQAHFRIVTPYLEHPPLFGLVAGGFAILNGAQDMYSVNLHTIRPLALILGTLSILLVYLFARMQFGAKIGLLSAFLYATIPTVVVGSRIVQNENFFIPGFLLSLILAVQYLRTKRIRFRNAAILCASLLLLAKMPWGAASFALILIFLSEKQFKSAIYTIMGVVFALAFYVVYGLSYNSQVFLNLLRFQAARYDITFESIFALVQKPYLIDRFYTDGWIYVGWISFFILIAINYKAYKFIALPLVAYFIVYLAGIPDEAGHGWYRYPFYPFLVISAAICIKEYFAKNWIYTFFFLSLIGSSLLSHTWGVTFGFSYFIYRVFIASWMFTLLPLLTNNGRLTRASQMLSYAWFIAFIFLNIMSIMLYNEQ